MIITVTMGDGTVVRINTKNEFVPNKRDTKNKFGRQARRSYNSSRPSHRLHWTEQTAIEQEFGTQWIVPAGDQRTFAYVKEFPTDSPRFIPNTRDQKRA